MPIPVTTFNFRQQNEASKAMRVARTTMRTTPIPATVGAFETRREHKGLKATTVTKAGGFEASKATTVTMMATPKDPFL